MSSDVEVHLEHKGTTHFAGIAYFTRSRGQVTTTFVHNQSYLAVPNAPALDPRIIAVSGRQYVAALPGAFGDGAPDRWGRGLIRKAAIAAGGRSNLDDVDYLLGVHDNSRQGALRYRMPGTTEFLGASKDIPKTIALPELLRASDQVAADDPDDLSGVKKLLAAGTGSLGGARPKATVLLDGGALGLAKFPHPGDERDVMAWEHAALEVAAAVGIDTPGRQLTKIDGRHVLLLRRFDRTEAGGRIAYMSAMTALEQVDGDHADYLDIAEALLDNSASLIDDRRELFDRVVLSVAIGNVDDHLRNHGFLATSGGQWRLSPVFDINPDPDSTARVTGIAGVTDRNDEPAALLELATELNLDSSHARARMAEIAAAARKLGAYAERSGVGVGEIASVTGPLKSRIAALEHEAGRRAPQSRGRQRDHRGRLR